VELSGDDLGWQDGSVVHELSRRRVRCMVALIGERDCLNEWNRRTTPRLVTHIHAKLHTTTYPKGRRAPVSNGDTARVPQNFPLQPGRVGDITQSPGIALELEMGRVTQSGVLSRYCHRHGRS